jgi:hypothetical protein
MTGRLRFARRFRLAPGVAVNLSRSGTSWSLGPRGAHLTLARGRRPMVNVGVPGTGIRYVAFGDRPAPAPPGPDAPRSLVRGCAVVTWLIAATVVWYLVSRWAGWL